MFIIIKPKGELTEIEHIYGSASNIIKKKGLISTRFSPAGSGVPLHLLNPRSRWHTYMFVLVINSHFVEMVVEVAMCIRPQLYSRLKYFNNYWMDAVTFVADIHGSSRMNLSDFSDDPMTSSNSTKRRTFVVLRWRLLFNETLAHDQIPAKTMTLQSV